MADAGATQSVSIRELRIVVSFGGQLRSLCKIFFGQSDVSIYVVPYAPTKRYSVGTQRLGEHAESVTFDAGAINDYEAAPKISFHQSGQVHANAGDQKVGPLRIPPLSLWRGAHLGTVLADHARSLPEFGATPRREGLRRDLVLDLQGEVESAAVALYLNGKEPSFDSPCPLHFSLQRPTVAQPVHLGLLPRAQAALANPDLPGSGVVAIGGWTPGQGREAAVDFLYIRGS